MVGWNGQRILAPLVWRRTGWAAAVGWGKAQGQNRGQLPRISQRVTRGGTVLSAERGGFGGDMGGKHFGQLEGMSKGRTNPGESFAGVELTCEDEGGGYRGPQHGVAAPVSLALQCRPD